MNQKEYAAILDDTELCHEARLVYMVFRRHMDIATGITGYKRVVCYNELSQSLDYMPARGSRDTSKRYSRDQIKRCIQQLVKRGYLIALHKKGMPGQRMVYRLPLATSDSVRLDEERHLSATEGTPQCASQETPVNTMPVADMSATRNAIGAPCPERHISDVSEYNHTVPYQDPSQIFPDAIDWVDYFITQHRFPPHRARTAASMPLFGQWCKDNITVGEMNEVVAIANLKNGTPPDSPIFYRRFVQQYRLERQRAEEQANTQLFAVGQNYTPDQPARPAGSPDSSKQHNRQRVTAAVMDIKDTSW